MPSPSKRTRRVLVLVGVVAGLCAVAGVAYVVRQQQLDDAARGWRESGREAYARAEWKQALDGLGRYVQRFQSRGADAEDFRMYGAARRRVPADEGRHLVGAILALRRSLELDPGSAATRSELLTAYLESGYATESLELLDEMIAAAPADPEPRRIRCDLLEQLHRFRDALEASKELARLLPDDITERFRVLRLMVRADLPASEIDAWVAAAVAERPDDPRLLILPAAVAGRRGETVEAAKLLDSILPATAAVRDPEFVRLLAEELDRAGRFGESLDVLMRIEGDADPALRIEVLRRLHFAGRSADLLDVAKRAGSGGSDPESRALECLALAATGRTDASSEARAGLASASDPAAAAWSDVVAHFLGGTADGGVAQKDRLLAACRALPQSALAHQALGESYLALGEIDHALTAWKSASVLAPSWSRPLLHTSRALLATDRRLLAPQFARAAVLRAPGDLQALSNHFEVLGAVANLRAESAAGAPLPKEMLTALDDSGRAVDERLPLLLDLLARSDRAAAESRLRAVLVGGGTATESTYVRLARVAERLELPLVDEFYALSEAAHGASPELALAKAMSRARGGGVESGLVVFDALRAKSRSGVAELDWQLARAAYLDATRRPDASSEWIRLADANPTVMRAQLGALSSAAVWGDRSAVERIVARIRSMSGPEAVTWRIARARWLLEAPDAEEAQIAEAAQLLNAVTTDAPESTSARLLLATALERLRNPSAAADQLAAAARVAPESTQIALEQARVAQSLGRTEEARRHLDRVLQVPDLPPEHVTHAARLASLQGDAGRGATLLESLDVARALDRDGMLLLARLYARLGRIARAIAICERLLATPDAPAVALTAELYAADGRADDARSVLRRLDSMKLRPGEREQILARHESTYGLPDAARRRHLEAIEAAPADAASWQGALVFVITAGDSETFGRLLSDPRGAAVDPVRALQAVRPLADKALPDPRLRPVLLTMVGDAAARPALEEALRIVVGSGGAAPDAAAALVVLADAHPRVLALQLLSAHLVAESGDPRRASQISRRAAATFPNAISAARQAAEMLSLAGRHEEALDAGRRWRDLTPNQDPAPTVFVADTLLRLDRADEAASMLEPWLDDTAAIPPRKAMLTLSYSIALVRTDRDERAADVLSRLVRSDPSWARRLPQVDPRALGSARSVAVWLDVCAAGVGGSDLEGRTVLAYGWYGAWQVYGGEELLERTRRASADVASLAGSGVAAALLEGQIEQGAGDLEKARGAYERVLAADPDNLVARNNLAMVLADLGRWQEAVATAQTAVRLRPDLAEVHDTLAYAHRKGSEWDRAAAALEAARRLEPKNPAWQLGLAEVHTAAGRTEEGTRWLAEAEATLADAPRDAPLRKRAAAVREALK